MLSKVKSYIHNYGKFKAYSSKDNLIVKQF